MRVASLPLGLIAVDDEEQRRRERAESERLLRVARDSIERTARATERIRRMTRIYEERLHGLRPRESR